VTEKPGALSANTNAKRKMKRAFNDGKLADVGQEIHIKCPLNHGNFTPAA
jgi:hypothetical protein